MKQVMLIVLSVTACTLFFESCKKDSSTVNSNGMPSIEGTWELRQAQTKTNPTVNYPAGNSSIVQFTKNNYSTFSNAVMIKTGQYSLTADATAETNVCLVLPSNEYRNRIIFDADNSSAKTFFQLSADSIKFVSGCFARDSGAYYVYVKQ
jgi:hypothetical protein